MAIEPNGATVTPEATRAAEIDAARPAWARKPAPPANGAGAPVDDQPPAKGAGAPPAPGAAPVKVDGKDALAAAAAKAENRAKGPNDSPGGTNGAPVRGADGKFQPGAGAKPGEGAPDPAADPNRPVKVVFPVMGRNVPVELTAAEADFLEKNPRFKAQIQKSLGAEMKFEQASKMETQARQVFEMFKDKSQIERALKALGYDDPRAVMEELLYKHIELERMTPEQREAHEAREKLKGYEDEKAQREQAEQAERHKRLTEHHSTEYQKAIVGAVSKSGLPATEETIGRVAFYMHAALTKLGKDLTPEQVIPLVREDYQRSLRRFVSVADPNTLLELLGEDGLKKVREFELSRLQGGRRLPGVPPMKGPVAQPNGAPPPQKKNMTVEEFRARNEKIKRGELVVGE